MHDKYLISTVFYKDAVVISKRMNLKIHEWIHIPFCSKERNRHIQGRRVSDLKYLIGNFSDEEKEYLLASSWKKVGDLWMMN